MKLLSSLMISILLFVITKAGLLPNNTVHQEKQLIEGSWMVKDEPGNIWVFTATECHWILNNEVLEKFDYAISNEISPSGLDHTFIDLYPLAQADKPAIYSYAINSLGPNIMTLEIMEPKHSFIKFERLKTPKKN